MSSIKIVTDSHSGITQEQAAEMGIEVLPMPFTIDGETYEEGVTISRDAFFEKLEQGAEMRTSQPSLDSVITLWNRVLEKNDRLLYLPISSGLSGSCSTATALSEQEEYKGRVYVADIGRIATPLRCSVMDAVELVKEGYDVEEIKEILEKAKADMSIYIAVENLEYLKRGGRISPATAAVGTLLNIKPVLRLNTGLLENFQRCRGNKKAHKVMIDALRHDLETIFKIPYEKGEVSLLAASSASLEETQEWVQEIQAAFPDMPVMCDNLSLGICCHVGPGGLGIGCSCRPARPR